MSVRIWIIIGIWFVFACKGLNKFFDGDDLGWELPDVLYYPINIIYKIIKAGIVPGILYLIFC